MTGVEYGKRGRMGFGGVPKFTMQGEYEDRQKRRSYATGFHMKFVCDICGNHKASKAHKAIAVQCSKTRKLRGET